LRTVIIWTIVPFINFIVWYYMGLYQRGCSVPFLSPSSLSNNKVVYNYSACGSEGYTHTSVESSSSLTAAHSHLPPFIQSNMADKYQFSKFKMDSFENYKKDELVHLKSAAAQVTELRLHPQQPCRSFVHTLTENKPFTCLAVVTSNSNPGSLNLIRFNKDQKKTGRVYNKLHPMPAGIFRNVANKKGRASQRAYTQPFLEHADEVQGELAAMMRRRGLGPGSDVTLMVTNDGEIDLFLNYACSCRAHNISLHNAIVFTGSR
jgi:hypothetical protein